MLACNTCFAACLKVEHTSTMADCIALDVECATACQLAISAMTRGSSHAADFCLQCAQACLACADACRPHAAPHCQHCAESCLRCARACLSLAASAQQSASQFTHH